MKNFYSKFVKATIALVTLFGISISANAETITICDGTDENKYIPFYFYYLDNASATSQVIYPASELEAIKGKQITGLKFYNAGYSNAWNSNMAVSLGEVEFSSLAEDNEAYISADFKEGFNGAVSGDETMNTLEFTLSTPIAYTGQNLVVEIKNTVTGSTYMQIPFYGKAIEGQINATYGYNSSFKYNQGFLPKVTITYEDVAQYGAKVSTENVNFSTIFTNETSVKEFTITNTGASDLTGTISGMEAPFSVEETTINIPSLTSVTIPVTFAPTIDGTYNQTLSIDLGEAGKFEVNLTGTSMTAPTGYQQAFDVEDKSLPEKWIGYNIKSTYDYDIYDYVYELSEIHNDYFVSTEIDGTKAITIYENANPRREYPSQYSIYMISPIVSGNIMITARGTYSEYTTGDVKAYKAVENSDGSFTIDENPIEITWAPTFTNTEWCNGIFSLNEKSRIAIFMSYSAVSMFAADKLETTTSIENIVSEGSTSCVLQGNTLVVNSDCIVKDYQIVSTCGNIIATDVINNNSAQVSFSYPAGLYIVKLATENGVSTHKVLSK
ncbi:MAG: T9SS type A sorting domain-containing protein [Muribaculaceae bacterium]|nr:T9SS type A sorting domain-containing protein [Muribaculaceae bacterium]